MNTAHPSKRDLRIRDALVTMYPEFYSMIKPKAEKKKRKCLICGTMRMSEGPHDRQCAQHTPKLGKLAEYTVNFNEIKQEA